MNPMKQVKITFISLAFLDLSFGQVFSQQLSVPQRVDALIKQMTLQEKIVQLYIRDLVGSVVRPVAELKDFKKIMLKKGESTTIHFVIDAEKLSFYNEFMEYGTEPGEFDLMIGASSRDIRLQERVRLE